MIKLLDSKLHGLRVTDANLNYVGSITLDVNYIEEIGMIPYQEVFIVNNNNGARIETYIIPGKRGQGDVCLNGAAARLFEKGDEIIVMSFSYNNIRDISNEYQPRILLFSYDEKGDLSIRRHLIDEDEFDNIFKKLS